MSYKKSEYLKMRGDFTPKPREQIKCIFVLESPPDSENYFYKIEGKKTEPLFSAMMKIIDESPKDKNEGLILLRDKGFLLVDATYTPVNKIKKESVKNKIILDDFENLISDLRQIMGVKVIPLILVKKNICLLEPRLAKKGFTVLNNGTMIPFPAFGHQKRFHEIVKKILSESNLN